MKPPASRCKKHAHTIRRYFAKTPRERVTCIIVEETKVWMEGRVGLAVGGARSSEVGGSRNLPFLSLAAGLWRRVLLKRPMESCGEEDAFHNQWIETVSFGRLKR